jgi:6-phosphofructokinase 2
VPRIPAIITVTLNPSLDLATAVDLVEPGRKLRCSGLQTDPGGGGINVSRMIQELGGRSDCLILAGGPAGAALGDMLLDRGIAVRPMKIAGMTRQNLTVDERATGRQYRFVLPGPKLMNVEWRRSLETIESRLRRGDILVASGSLPPGTPADLYARMARIARRRHAKFLIDASGPALKAGLAAGVDFIKPNRHEFRGLSGEDRDDWRLVALHSARWVGRGLAGAVLVTRGNDGALLTDGSGHWRIEAPDVPIRSAVGAGDSCMGAIALRMAHGAPLLEACRFGVAAAAAAMLTPATELARRKDVHRLVRATRSWRFRPRARTSASA